MHAVIRINMDNEAFQCDQSREVARILRDLADRLERRDQCESPIGLRDVNGNTVGTFNVYP